MQYLPFRAVLAGFVVASLAACLPGPTAPDDELLEGEIAFHYSGAIDGEFRARGTVQNELPNAVRYGTWSAAFYQQSSDRTRLIGFQALSEPTGRIVEIRLGRVDGQEAIEIDPDLCDPGSSACPALIFDPNGTNEALLRGEWSPSTYVAVEGRVELDPSSSGRVSGRFSGSLARQGESEPRLQIVDGRFDVPVLYPDIRD